MTPKRAFAIRLQKISKEWVKPVLHAHGFKLNGRIYVRELEQMRHLLNTESDDLNTPEQYSFTLNCGIMIPEVMCIWWNREVSPKMEAASGTLNVRPGHLLPEGNPWWYLKASDDPARDADIGRHVQRIVEQGAIPFFQRFMTPLSVAEFLSVPRCKADRPIHPMSDAYARAYAAILWRMLGHVDKCKECIMEAISLSRKTPGREVVDKFAARFSCEG